MKKIMITISRGWIARNLLKNNFFRILREKYQIILLTPAFRDKRFIKEFGHKNVRFLPLNEYPWSPADRFISKLHKMLIWNPSVALKFRYGILSIEDREISYLKYHLTKIIFYPLSKLKFLRDLMRWVDYQFLQKGQADKFVKLIEHERPGLIICTHITSDTESALIKAAKKCGVQSWAMPKSWDNLSSTSFRVKSNRLIVWNEYMMEKASKYQNYKPEEIDIVGVAQYDHFVNRDELDEYGVFCEKVGLSPERKTIFFGSEGKLFVRDPEIASIIYKFIEDDELIEKCQLFIRPHYGYKDDEKKFKHLIGAPHVAVDMYNRKSNDFRDQWDYSEEFTNRFLNSIFHSSVIINTCSTLTLDAATLDRPAINVMFDGYDRLPYSKSLVRWYDNDYYRAVLETGGTKKVFSREELKKAINNYLINPGHDSDGRERLRKKFCYKIDGYSGARYANLVINFLEGQHVDQYDS
ncbi:hypothetical protein KKF29_03140 [Patescibacteria group bacterium]|nr:hypothetical protein [Patescibacteria group bacterium]